MLTAAKTPTRLINTEYVTYSEEMSRLTEVFKGQDEQLEQIKELLDYVFDNKLVLLYLFRRVHAFVPGSSAGGGADVAWKIFEAAAEYYLQRGGERANRHN